MGSASDREEEQNRIAVVSSPRWEKMPQISNWNSLSVGKVEADPVSR